MPQKIALIFGTRPEAIKLAPVYLELKRRPTQFTPLLWLTGQHRQMLDQVMATFGLTADRDLNLMQPGQSLVDVTAGVLRGVSEIFAAERPDCILVQGDTTTVLAAALAAFYQKIPVGHVEAGLRTHNLFSPFPEEGNRQLTTRLSNFHFAPTTQSRDNLRAEGIAAEHIWVTGNTVIDALDIVVKNVRAQRPELPSDFPLHAADAGRRIVMITGHRRENFGAGFENLCKAIAALAGKFPAVEFVYPVHLNPNVREPVYRILQGHTNIHLIEPLSYEPFVWAMDKCHFLLSDSGGVQEEAPHLGKPVLVMRDTTERPEAIDAGTCKLVGTDTQTIVTNATELLTNETIYAAMSQSQNPFGDGHASERIADALAQQQS